MLKIGHVVTRPGKKIGDPDVNIPVAEELETVPGIPTNRREVDWYAREYPLETMDITERASRGWAGAQTYAHPELLEIRKERDRLTEPLTIANRLSGELEPTQEPSGEDVAQLIKEKARELRFAEAGITAYDHRYTFQSKKDAVMFPHAVCLVYEEEYEATQTIPSVANSAGRLRTFPTQAAAALELGNFIRSLGYHAQVIHNAAGVVIPMFVEAGVGQMGACGYLLTPHVGNRGRLMVITTDAKVTYDQPVDYGIHAFCQVCQVCVNRCPGRALMRDKIWFRGIEKNKLYFKRCRPVMARYLGCGVCMKVCPIQKYGMMNVMEHYAATGQVLGKGTHDLEGYTLEGKGYFGPGEMPVFEPNFFNSMPRGTSSEWAFDRFKAKAKASGGVITDELLAEFKDVMSRAVRTDASDPMAMTLSEEVMEEVDAV